MTTFRCFEMILIYTEKQTRTSKLVGLSVSQLRVHPTTSLNLASRLAAKAWIAVTAVSFAGLLDKMHQSNPRPVNEAQRELTDNTPPQRAYSQTQHHELGCSSSRVESPPCSIAYPTRPMHHRHQYCTTLHAC
jgi:hypothetical protein